ncbi:phenylalanine--tRNA ligase subunit beta [Allisonella histaminiformans]|uniref:phenylalanine--tRNA ligase subunit beta n=1 Tax=Allisonella histaminiformans TaxID=209880 RepID=UPI002E790345|nr:phenylalanine--tRNA ligase subunit beta [Allisonella histaminiformans]
MNVSLKWLGTLVDIKGFKPEDMAEVLTCDGIPVEHVIHPAPGIKGVVTGKILKVEKHPDAAHLLVCQLDVGQDEPVQIITSADNVKAGQIVPAALPGAHLPAKHDHNAPGGIKVGDVKIKKGKLRGLPSAGMMCSASEMLLDYNLYPGTEPEGIMILPANTPVGVDFHHVFDLDDVIFEMELTPNRADCFSMVGMALETGAIFNRKVTLPEVKVKEEGPSINGRASIHIAEPEYCSRFCSRLLENVKIGRSPEWIESRLRSNNIRPINNIVDAANYVMLEMGQPMHTYDYDKITGHSLTLRHAKDGEVLVTLDGEKRTLTSADLVIADEKGAVGLAGVMGGLNSEITESTTSVLLESAVFDSASIRRTSRRLGLRSEASGRYEKGINAKRSAKALNRICQILEEQGACTVASDMLDEYPNPKPEQVIHTSFDAINDYIGIHLPDEQITDILTRLHFKVENNNREIAVTVPEFRLDVEGRHDLAEEVARVYGYANIPITTPWSAIAEGEMSQEQEASMLIEDTLINNGLSQVLNYSFMHKDDLKRLNYPETHKVFNAIPIMNPISEEYPDLRTTLMPGLIHTLKYNLAQKNSEVSIFEIGRVYYPKALPLTELPVEDNRVSALLSGTVSEEGYPNDHRPYDFFDIKGIVENVLAKLGITDYDIQRSVCPVFHPGVSADFVKDGKVLVSFGELHPAVLDNFDIKQKVYGFSMSLSELNDYISGEVAFQPIPKFPASARDLAILVPEELSDADVEAIITKRGGKHLESLTLFDLYQGKQVPEGYKSMAYSLAFRAPDRTLTDSDVDTWIKKIVDDLEKNGCKLRE